jgi:hypothetical protein
VDHKVCRSCGETKLLTEFRKRSTRSDGYQSYCKACANRRNTIYQRTTGKEKVSQHKKEYLRKYRRLHRSGSREQRKAWTIVAML